MQPNQIFYPREVISVADVKVDLDSLGYLSGSYRGLSDTVSSAQTYQTTHINLNASGKVSGVSTAVLNQAKKVEDALTTWLSDTEKATSGSADCVDDCVRSYQENERVSAELFDGHYTPADVASARSGASSTASGKLTTPAAQKTFATVFNALGMVGNSISPSYWLGTAADAVLDLILGQGEHDPFAAIGNTIAGDWEPFSVASDALSKMSDYFKELGTETKNYWNNVDPDWDGGASDAASDALGKMGTSFDDASERLTKFSSSYNAVAVGVYDTADTLAGLLRTLADWGIAAVASAAAGTATFETVVGPIVGYVAAGAAVLKVLSTVREIFDVLGKVWDFVTLFTGQCSLWLGLVHGSGDPLTIYKPSFSEQ